MDRLLGSLGLWARAKCLLLLACSSKGLTGRNLLQRPQPAPQALGLCSRDLKWTQGPVLVVCQLPGVRACSSILVTACLGQAPYARTVESHP